MGLFIRVEAEGGGGREASQGQGMDWRGREKEVTNREEEDSGDKSASR